MNERPARRYQERSKHLVTGWLDLEQLNEQNRQLRALLFEQLMRRPTVFSVTAKVEEMLTDERQAALFYVNVLGDPQAADVATSLGQLESQLAEADLSEAVIEAEHGYVLVAVPKERPLKEETLIQIKEALRREAEAGRCYVGASLLQDAPNVRFERLVEETLGRAMENSRPTEPRGPQLMTSERSLKTSFVPIIDFQSSEVVAYQALTFDARGNFLSPDKILKLALEGNLLAFLDQLQKKTRPRTNPVFICVDPGFVGTPDFEQVAHSLLTTPPQPQPSSIVFVLSEEAVTRDFDYFGLVARYLKAAGFRVAISGVKNPATWLEIATELKPEFVELDASLSQGVAQDEVKQQLIEAILRFASRAGAYAIADGVQATAQIEGLKAIGVRFGLRR